MINPVGAGIGGAPHAAVVAGDQARPGEDKTVLVYVDAIGNVVDLGPGRPVELPQALSTDVQQVRIERIDGEHLAVPACVAIPWRARDPSPRRGGAPGVVCLK